MWRLQWMLPAGLSLGMEGKIGLLLLGLFVPSFFVLLLPRYLIAIVFHMEKHGLSSGNSFYHYSCTIIFVRWNWTGFLMFYINFDNWHCYISPPLYHLNYSFDNCLISYNLGIFYMLKVLQTSLLSPYIICCNENENWVQISLQHVVHMYIYL